MTGGSEGDVGEKGGWGPIEGGRSPSPILQVTEIAVPAATLARNQCGAYAARVSEQLTSGPIIV